MLPRLRRHKAGEPARHLSNLDDRQNESRHDDEARSRFELKQSPTDATTKTTLSNFDMVLRGKLHPNATNKAKERSRDRRLDPLGLTVLYEPDTSPVADIVFVHGLGGTSRQTWTRNRDPDLFWPLEWLPFEPGMADVRISTFGYNAHFMSSAEACNILNISDFAKDLLFQLRFATGAEERPLNVGNAPLIFVAHSMGGLVVKKAFILGQNDMHYKKIIESISSVVFLSTPHRGTNLADLLNKVLSACIFGFSPKQYIAELKNNSPTIQEINEQFRNLAPSVDIVSFFETQMTAVGPSHVLILQRDSSTLGYPAEISKPLNADHHNICKFSSRQDPNYTSVRDILKYLVEKSRPTTAPLIVQSSMEELQTLEAFLGSPETPTDDHEFFADKRLEGSCEWLLEEPLLLEWFESNILQPHILWCTGKPGSGKSVGASFLVGTLQEQGLPNAFYFFRFGDQVKNSLTGFLLSSASQIAAAVPEYRRRLLRMFDDGVNVQKLAPRLIWQKLFVSALFKVSVQQPIFLVVDALDETESAPLLLRMFADLADQKLPIRLLLVSRPTQALTAGMERLGKRINLSHMPLDHTERDLQLYVTEEMQSMRGDEDFKNHVTARILEKADGNFLWVHLVVNEILQCHTEDAVEEALSQVPEDLEPLYERMDEALAKSTKPADQALGRTLLMWAACSRYPLTLPELSGALQPEYPRVLDLKHTAHQVCGEFVVIDKKLHIAMIHSSARDYLTTNPALNYYIQPEKAHQTMFTKCIKILITWNPRAKIEVARGQSFFFYAITSWPFHLQSSSCWLDQESLGLLSRFFRQQSVLHWIFLLASSGRLRTLIQASKVLANFLKASDRLDSERSPLTHRLQDKEVLSRWAHDLVRIVGKFGAHLVHQPKAIYQMVPAFCPQNSIIRSQALPSTSSYPLIVKGAINPQWDDCLARFSVNNESMPLQIITLDRYFAIITADGSVRLYYSATCDEARAFHHGERVLVTCFSPTGDKMATYGFFKTKVWDTRTARQLCAIDNPQRTKALSMTFDEYGEMLMTCSDDRFVRSCTLAAPQYGWKALEEPLGFGLLQPRQANSPRKAQFSPDGTMIAVTYRGLHLSVWSLSPSGPQFLSQCERRSDHLLSNSRVQTVFTDAQSFCWNPLTGHIIGIFNDGCVFKWHPVDDDYEFSNIRATHITCSADGKFFATSSGNGALRIWDFYHFTTIYQLSYAASVTDLAIDRNESRIYDIREKFCNVWEPNALYRLLETDERASDALSTIESSTYVSIFSEAAVENAEPITALALDTSSGSYVVGDDGGTLVVFDHDGSRQTELSGRFMTIEHVSWSPDGQCIASADLSRSIMIEQLVDIDGQHPAMSVSTVLVINEENSIRQLIQDPSGSYLLVITDKFLKLWSVTEKKLVCKIPTKTHHKWCYLSSNPDQIIGFGHETILLASWSPGLNIQEMEMDYQNYATDIVTSQQNEMKRRPSTTYPMSPSDIEVKVSKALLCHDETLALVQTSQATFQGKREKQCMLIDLSSLRDGAARRSVEAQALPMQLRAVLELPLGFVAEQAISSGRRWSSSAAATNNPISSPFLSPSLTRAISPTPTPTAPSPTMLNITTSQTPPQRRPAHGEAHVLVFLSRDCWICTFNFGDGPTARVKRHFFLPRDWLNMDLLELAVVTPEGSILCPRNGEVAIIAGGLGEEWVD